METSSHPSLHHNYSKSSIPIGKNSTYYTLLVILTALIFAYFFKHRVSSSILSSLPFQANKNNHMTKKKKKKNLPPGSYGLPIVGESISFMRALTKNTSVDWVESRVSDHGPVFKTSILGSKVAVFTGQAGNRFVFGGGDGALASNQPKSAAKIFGKHSMFEMSGERHKLVRSAVVAFMKPESINRYLGQMEAVINEMLFEELDGKDSVCAVPLMKKMSFNVAGSIFFGLPDGKERDQLLEDFTTTVKGVWTVPIDFPGTVFHRALKARERLCEKLSKIVGLRRRQIEEGKPNDDVITSLLLLRDGDGEPLLDVEVLDIAITLIMASHDTVIVVLNLFIRLLARDPQVFEKVLEEHKEFVSAKRGRSGDDEGKLNWNDIQMMKYTWRVAQELMRLNPPIFGNFRRVTSDINFDGYDIPKGWQVFWVCSGTHLDDNIFEDPLKFDPSRFDSTTKSYPPYAYIPFGAGPRICPGSDFARVEILLVIHHMLTHYRWAEIVPDEPISCQPVPLPAMGLPIKIWPISQL